jgi:hypothetical protein
LCKRLFVGQNISMDVACGPDSAAVAAGQLVSGVGLHDPDGLLRTCPDRLALSSGTRPVGSLALSDYRDTAFVPRGPWREPGNQERRLLLAAEPPVSIGSHVTLVRVPDEVMAHFAALRDRLHSCSSADELRGWLDRHSLTTGCDAMLDFFRIYLRSQYPLMEGGGIVCRETGLPTTTTNDTGKYIGLHVDSWYRAKLTERANAPNRISINLGLKARFFLYINLPLATVAALAVEQYPPDSRIRENHDGLHRTFMSHFGSYPVVRMRLDPGEGYIAPTENLIHDATTPGKKAPDVQYRVRGRFWPG